MIQSSNATSSLPNKQLGMICFYLLAPGVCKPVETIQLVVPQFKLVCAYVRRLFLQSSKPGVYFLAPGKDGKETIFRLQGENDKETTAKQTKLTEKIRNSAIPYISFDEDGRNNFL